MKFWSGIACNNFVQRKWQLKHWRKGSLCTGRFSAWVNASWLLVHDTLGGVLVCSCKEHGECKQHFLQRCEYYFLNASNSVQQECFLWLVYRVYETRTNFIWWAQWKGSFTCFDYAEPPDHLGPFTLASNSSWLSCGRSLDSWCM